MVEVDRHYEGFHILSIMQAVYMVKIMNQLFVRNVIIPIPDNQHCQYQVQLELSIQMTAKTTLLISKASQLILFSISSHRKTLTVQFFVSKISVFMVCTTQGQGIHENIYMFGFFSTFQEIVYILYFSSGYVLVLCFKMHNIHQRKQQYQEKPLICMVSNHLAPYYPNKHHVTVQT